MITCHFEDGHGTNLRHLTADVVAIRAGSVLLVRRAEHLVEGGKWALPGGYMDPNETLRATAVREFLEETGYACSNVRLFNLDSRPKRPGNERQNVTGVFLVDVGEWVQDPDLESTDIKWFPLESFTDFPDIAFGHDQYVNQVASFLREEFTLPLLDGEPVDRS